MEDIHSTVTTLWPSHMGATPDVDAGNPHANPWEATMRSSPIGSMLASK